MVIWYTVRFPWYGRKLFLAFLSEAKRDTIFQCVRDIIQRKKFIWLHGAFRQYGDEQTDKSFWENPRVILESTEPDGRLSFAKEPYTASVYPR